MEPWSDLDVWVLESVLAGDEGLSADGLKDLLEWRERIGTSREEVEDSLRRLAALGFVEPGSRRKRRWRRLESAGLKAARAGAELLAGLPDARALAGRAVAVALLAGRAAGISALREGLGRRRVPGESVDALLARFGPLLPGSA